MLLASLAWLAASESDEVFSCLRSITTPRGESAADARSFGLSLFAIFPLTLPVAILHTRG